MQATRSVPLSPDEFLADLDAQLREALARLGDGPPPRWA